MKNIFYIGNDYINGQITAKQALKDLESLGYTKQERRRIITGWNQAIEIMKV